MPIFKISDLGDFRTGVKVTITKVSSTKLHVVRAKVLKAAHKTKLSKLNWCINF